VTHSREPGGFVDIAIGTVIGAVVGMIAAVNLVIFVGIEEGYEASIGDVFRQNAAAGVATIVLVVFGPVVGGLLGRRRLR
jgi:uncharacterized membrane protein